MTQEQKILYTIKKKDFLNYAEKWFQKELAKTVKQVDDCLAKVQELKEAGDAYPQKVLLPICDIISLYKFDDTCLYDPYYYSYYYYYRDFIEYDFVRETQQYTKNKDCCFNENEESNQLTRIIFSNQPDDYEDWPSADYLVIDNYNEFVASVVKYALKAALAKSDILSAAIISGYTERVEFEYDEDDYNHAKDAVDALLDKTPLFSDVQYDETNLKAKNKEKVARLISKFIDMRCKARKKEALKKKKEAYELLKKTYPDYPEIAEKLLS
jgi:hypothetical protein